MNTNVKKPSIHTAPKWLADAVFYQIYPQSFYDSNGDGIGDIHGIISKLDYIQSLGVNALWLNPVFESPFADAGYDISDFYKVAPRYGTNKDLCQLIKQAHKRGIRVCLDLVAGHTSIEHPWFKASASPESNRYSDWYIWTSSAWENGVPNVVRGFSDRDGGYVSNFFYCQPALNYGYAKPEITKPWQRGVSDPAVQAVRLELKKIMQFWLDKGADGFRIDMAASLVRGDPDGTGLRQLWQYYRSWLDESYPEAVLISEWCSPRQAIDAGFDIDFLIHFNESAYNVLLGTPWGADSHAHKSHHPPFFFDRSGKGDIKRFLKSYLPHYIYTKSRGYISLPTGNHDFPRQRVGREERDLRVIQAMLLMMPGVPFIYYGDEIGMRYLDNLPAKEGSYKNRTGSRTPMQWDRSRNAGFSTAPAKKLYLPVDTATDAPNVNAQESDPQSLLNFCRRLLTLRRSNDALGNSGDFKVIFAEKNTYPFVFERSNQRERYWIAINPSAQSVNARLPMLKSASTVEQLDARITLDKKSSALSMGPVSFGIFKVD